jgi:hypothetical protein
MQPTTIKSQLDNSFSKTFLQKELRLCMPERSFPHSFRTNQLFYCCFRKNQLVSAGTMLKLRFPFNYDYRDYFTSCFCVAFMPLVMVVLSGYLALMALYGMAQKNLQL